MDPLAIGALAYGIGSTVYNAYQSWRNNQYQKSLQQEVFNREDNAIQRQVADAEQAGFNKFAVMGNNGAGAGSVVSTTAPEMDTQAGGKMFDTLNAVANLSVNRSSAEIAKANAVKAESDSETAVLANEAYQAQVASEYAKILRENGIPANFGAENGHWIPFIPDSWSRSHPQLETDFLETPAGQEFLNYYSQQSSKTSILESDERYKDIKAIADIIGTLLGGGSSAVNAGVNAYKARKGLKK